MRQLSIKRSLFFAIRVLVFDSVRRQQDVALAALAMVLQFEGTPLFTQNTHYISATREKWLTRYKNARRKTSRDSRAPTTIGLWPQHAAPGVDFVQEALAFLNKAGYSVKEEDLVRLEPVDEYEEELGVMADVRAYFQVAYKVGMRNLVLNTIIANRATHPCVS